MKLGTVWTLGLVGLASACTASRQAKTAGAIGCPAAEITIGEVDRQMGWNQSSKTWPAECRGRKFMCTEVITSGGTNAQSSQITCAEELAPASTSETVAASAPAATAAATAQTSTAASEKVKAPDKVAGFERGSSLETVQSVCSAAGQEFQAAGKQATCSGTGEDLGFAASTAFEFCDDELCGLQLEAAGTAPAKLVSNLKTLKQALVNRYGEPQSNEVRYPQSCQGDALAKCLAEGQAYFEYSWTWKSGEAIKLKLGDRQKQDASETPITPEAKEEPPTSEPALVRIAYDWVAPELRDQKATAIKGL